MAKRQYPQVDEVLGNASADSFDIYRSQVNCLLGRFTVESDPASDLGLDDDTIQESYESGDSPEQLVDWFTNKNDLMPIS